MAAGSERGWMGRKKQAKEEQRQQALVQDSRFQVLTFDKLNWINPYTGQIVSVPFDTEKAISDYLLQQPWKSGKEPLPLLKLTQIEWIHYLMRNMNSEELSTYI